MSSSVKKVTIVTLILLLGISLAGAPHSTTSAASSEWAGISNSPSTSANSAGYTMHATMGTVNAIHTELTVPKITCSPAEENTAVYIVGLDNPPEAREAAGISFGCSTGTPTYSGYYVIANAPHNYGTIHPDDHFSATAMFSSSMGVTIILKDLTKGHTWSQTFTGTDPAATKTDFAWNLVLFPGPTLPNFGKLHTFNDWATLNNRMHSIGYWSVNSGVTTEQVTMQAAPTNKLAFPSFVNDEENYFNIIWVAAS